MDRKKLLIIKEKMKKFVGRNEVFILPILKFAATFLALNSVSTNLGYMERLANPAITLIVALAGSFLPMNLTLVIIALITTAHIYALSFECAIVVLALFLVLFLLYFRFPPKDAAAVIVAPVLFTMKIPYVLPISLGLIGEPTSMVSAGCSVIVYYVLHFINVNAKALSGTGDESKMSAFKGIIDGLISDKAMIVMAFAFAVTVLVVYIIRRMTIKYAWSVAIGTGSVLCFFIILIGKAATDAGISVGGAFVGIVISIILNIILQYFCFDLDYNRTEKVQFEDDEYYYYVKAVPKNTIKLSDKGMKKKAPVQKQVSRPTVTPVNIANENKSMPGQSVSQETTARAAVRATAANAARVKSANKGPLGMSGGRSAGEVRRLKEDGKDN